MVGQLDISVGKLGNAVKFVKNGKSLFFNLLLDTRRCLTSDHLIEGTETGRLCERACIKSGGNFKSIMFYIVMQHH